MLYVTKALSRPQNSISASADKRETGDKVQLAAACSWHCEPCWGRRKEHLQEKKSMV